MKVWKPATSYSLDRETGWGPLMAEVGACGSVEAVRTLWTAFVLERLRNYPEAWCLAFRDACAAREDELLVSDQHDAMDAEFKAMMGGLV